MNNITPTSKPVSRGWDRLDIRYALERRGWSLSRLSVANGYYRTAAKEALDKRWPQLEWIIAEALDLKPWQIWPNRYPDGPTTRPARRLKRLRKPCTNTIIGD